MKIKYIIIAIIFLGCSCEDASVTGFVIADDIETPTSDNSSTTETVEENPTLLIQPQILIPIKPVDDNTNETDASQQSQVLPVATSIEATDEDANVTETTIQDNDETISATDVSEVFSEKLPVDDSDNSTTTETVEENPQILMQPLILTAQKSIDDNSNESDSSQQPQVLPVLTSVKTTDENLTNPKCNTTACPKYKCGTYLIPANLTAGECCDRCAPASVKPTATTKKPSSKPTKLTSRPKTTRPSSSSEEEEEDSSSEQYDGKPLRWNIRPFNSKPNRSYSRLIRLLTEVLAHFRYSHPHRQHNDFDE